MAKRRRAYTKTDIEKWTKQLTSRVNDIGDEFEENTERAVEKIMELADEYVPEDTKLTKNSAYWEVTREKDRIRANFGYDRNNEVDYLSIIYYNLNQVTWKKNGARDMWLDVAFQEMKDEAYDIIAGRR